MLELCRVCVRYMPPGAFTSMGCSADYLQSLLI